MKKKSIILGLCLSMFLLSSCGKSEKEEPEQQKEPQNIVIEQEQTNEEEQIGKAEEEAQESLQVLDSGYEIRSDEKGFTFIYYGVSLKNNSADKVASFPSVVITTKDEAGKILSEQEQILRYIAPEDTVSYGGVVNCNEVKPASVEITAKCTDYSSDEPDAVVRSSELEIMNVQENFSDGNTVFTGEVKNNSLQDISMAAVTILVKNEGKIVMGTTAYAMDLLAGQSSGFELNEMNIPKHDEIVVTAQCWM